MTKSETISSSHYTENHMQNTAMWFETAVPTPTIKNMHTQIGVHFEEVGEMLEALSAKDNITRAMLLSTGQSMRMLAKHLKQNDNVLDLTMNLQDLLDALCDQLVTAIGTGYMLKLPILDALHEVNRSNWSKFVKGNPVFDKNMKIIKGPDYFKPDLSKFFT